MHVIIYRFIVLRLIFKGRVVVKSVYFAYWFLKKNLIDLYHNMCVANTIASKQVYHFFFIIFFTVQSFSLSSGASPGWAKKGSPTQYFTINDCEWDDCHASRGLIPADAVPDSNHVCRLIIGVIVVFMVAFETLQTMQLVIIDHFD